MRKQSGFTLMEMLITMVVAGVLVGMAVPSFKTTIQNSRLVTQSNDVLSMVMYARSEAINSGKNVTVCASSDQATCSGTNWASGWIVCQESNTTNTGCGTSMSVLRVQAAITGSNTLTNTSSLSKVTFQSTGALTTNAGLYFDVCDSRGASYGRSVYIYPAGQARVSSTAGKKLDGTALTC